ILPLAGFLMMHGSWSPGCDTRLYAYPFSASELGMFGWRYVLYGVTFAITYLLIRRHAAVRTTAFSMPSPSTKAAILLVFAGLYIGKTLLKVVYHYDPDDPAVYTNAAQVAAEALARPLLIGQIGHNIHSAFLLSEFGVLILLTAYWRKRWCRYLLIAWLGSMAVRTAVQLGSRSVTVLLLLSAGVLYHRLVKPVSVRVAAVGGAALLSAFLVAGALRGNYESGVAEGPRVLMAANEFQGLFTTALDLHKRKQSGELGPVPWQVYVSDFYFPVPSQFLPFQKIDPGAWYIDVIGQTGAGIGYMFGVMSQAAIGLDWIEVAFRGAILAACLALMHRWYVRHALGFWPTLFYLFVSVWIYYTMRASTFYFLYNIVYQFLPLMVLTRLVDVLLRRIHRKREAI
ncbi:MAG: hypothetical protein QOE82_261, partial [Thermoanaerobaculia bacterium]|nr:hypothetical protein [Thermoanaerobaculia bacterium]